MSSCRKLLEEFQKCQQNSEGFCFIKERAYEACVRNEKDEEEALERLNRWGRHQPLTFGLSPSLAPGVQLGGGLMLDSNGYVTASII